MRRWEALSRAELLAAAPRAVAQAARQRAGTSASARAELLVDLGRSPHLAELEDQVVTRDHTPQPETRLASSETMFQTITDVFDSAGPGW